MTDAPDRGLQGRTEAEALFRYQMIAPLIDPLATEDEKTRWRREVTDRDHMLPDGSRRRVSKRTLRRWAQAYRVAGFEGLKRLPRLDRGVLRALSPEARDLLRALKEEAPQRSIPQLIRVLEAAGKVEPGTLSPKTVWRYLAPLGLSQRHRIPSREQYRRFEAARSGELWQGDASHGPLLPNPEDRAQRAPGVRRTYLLAFLDDHSRFVVHAEFFWAEDLYALELCFQRALLRGGLPRRVYVDRGMIYQAELFTRACAELGIHHLSATAGRPEGKGKIERFFQTFQAEFLPELSLHPVQTLEALNERLWAWIEEAYHVRPHSETGEPPAERFLRDLERRTVPPEQLQRVFLWRQVRRVDKTGVLQFAGNRYQAPPGTEYRKVELRYHPLHLEELEVWREGHFVGKAKPLDLYRSRLDRVARAHEPASSERRTGLPYLELLLQRHEERKHQIVSPLRFDPEPRKEVKADV